MFKELFTESKKYKNEDEMSDAMHDIFKKTTGFVRAGWDEDGIEFMYDNPKNAKSALKKMGHGKKYGWVEYFKTLEIDPDDENVIIGAYDLSLYESLFGSLYESNELKQALKKLSSMDQQRFKIITLDRLKTNYDTTWQKEYFYGDLKDKSKSDMTWYMKKWVQMFPDKIDGKRVTEEILGEFYVGDLKKYFK